MAKYLLIYSTGEDGIGRRMIDVEAEAVSIGASGVLELLGPKSETIRALSPDAWSEVVLEKEVKVVWQSSS